MKLNCRTYDVLKWVALVLLPAVQVLWLALGKIWGFPYLVEIGATIAAVDVFIGSLLGVSTEAYRAEKQQDNTGTGEDDLFDDDAEEYDEEDEEDDDEDDYETENETAGE